MKSLFVIPPNEWHILLNLFKTNWPRDILAYYTIQNYIKWHEQNPLLDEIAIYSTDSNWRTHGTFILEDRNALYCYIFFHTLYAKNQHLMLAGLQNLELKPVYITTSHMKKVNPAVKEHLRYLGILNQGKGYHSACLYYLPKEKCLHLEMKPLEGFVAKKLTQSDIKTVDNLWPHRHPGSDYYIERVIKHNLSFGIFATKSNELCAWVMQSENGTIGLLQVTEKYKRRGFGEYLVRLLARALAENDLDSIAIVLEANAQSRGLFEKMGFEIIDNYYWYDNNQIFCSKL